MMKKLGSTLFLTFLLLIPLVATCPSTVGATPLPKNTVYVDKNNHSYIPLRLLNSFTGIQSVWNLTKNV